MSIQFSPVAYAKQTAETASIKLTQAADSVKNGVQVAGKTLKDSALLVAAIVKAVALAVLVKIATPFVSNSTHESLTERANSARQEVNRLRSNNSVEEETKPSIKDRAIDLGKAGLATVNNHKGKLALLAGLAATGAAAYAYGPSIVESFAEQPVKEHEAVAEFGAYAVGAGAVLIMAKPFVQAAAQAALDCVFPGLGNLNLGNVAV